MTDTPIIDARGLHSFYGVSHILHGVDFSVRAGEAVGLMGRNGMGKTTLIRTIVGFTPPREGRVLYEGTEITRLPSFRMVALGMALVPQGRRVFPSLSVRENLDVARRGTGTTICAFYDGAVGPYISYIEKFRDEFEALVTK